MAGPDFWGLVNPDWYLCSRGLHQSPVDVDPRRLLYDPHLSPFRIERQRVRVHHWQTFTSVHRRRKLLGRAGAARPHSGFFGPLISLTRPLSSLIFSITYYISADLRSHYNFLTSTDIENSIACHMWVGTHYPC